MPRKQPIKVTELLKKDHGVFRRLLAEYEKLDRRPPTEKREIYGQLFHELEVHAVLERELLPKERRKPCPADVRRDCRRHARIDRLLKSLASREPEDQRFAAGMRALKQEVEKHIVDEEQRTFPAAEAALPAGRLEDLAVLVAARRARFNEGSKG